MVASVLLVSVQDGLSHKVSLQTFTGFPGCKCVFPKECGKERSRRLNGLDLKMDSVRVGYLCYIFGGLLLSVKNSSVFIAWFYCSELCALSARDWRKELRLYGLFWAGGWRPLECAWGRVIMWPLGTRHPQQKTGTPLSVCSSRGALFRSCHSQPLSVLISLLFHNNNCLRPSPIYCVLREDLRRGGRKCNNWQTFVTN